MQGVVSLMESEVLKIIVRGLAKPLILWFLLRRAMHGYEILNQLAETTGQRFSPGTVYPMLYQMEEAGLITGEWEQRGKRRRKLYRITEKGLHALKQFGDVFSKCFDLLFRDIANLSQSIYQKIAGKESTDISE